jgi:tetratricopeptide (TPR) repeat protein
MLSQTLRRAGAAAAIAGMGVCVSPAPAAAGEAAAAPGIAWEETFPKALKQARKLGKPVMADFWAEWCHWCEKLDRETYSDPAVIELSRRFVPVKVNTEGGLEEREITYEYGFVELPTIAFFSPEGHLLTRLERYQGPQDFLETLRGALEVAERVAAWERDLEADDQATRAASLAELGAHLFGQGRLDESRKLLEKAAKRDAARPVSERKATRVDLGRIRLAQAKEKDAARLAREALALEPAERAEDARALVLLGSALHRAGDVEEARTAWERALATDPDGAAAEEARAALRAAGGSR